MMLPEKEGMVSMRTTKDHSMSIKGIAVLGDFILLNLCFYFTFLLYKNEMNMGETWQVPFILVNLAYATSLSYVGIILDKRDVFIEMILIKVLKTIVLFSMLLLGVLVFMHNLDFMYGHVALPVPFWITFCPLLLVLIAGWRIIARIVLKQYRIRGGNYRKVIILGADSVANELYQSLIKNVAYGYKFMGFFDDRDPKEYVVSEDKVKGTIDDVPEFVEKNQVEEIFCALPAGEDRKALPIIKYAENNMVRCFIVPDFRRFLIKKVNLSFWEEIPIISLREEPLLSLPNRFIKRAFDILFSFTFLVTLFPLVYIILGIAIKISSPGPIIFKQKRTGKAGCEFECFKFRTMRVNKEADSLQATRDDNRITKFGSLLRQKNFDELPQFINVFFGQMSVAGPRPHMLKHTEMYSQVIDKYMVRHFAKPGITGWAQVTGYRGETRELAEMEGRIKRDVWYIENWTFWLDIKIVFLTIINMFKKDEKAY